MVITKTEKIRSFINIFDGDVEASMRAAGFTGASAYLRTEGEKLLQDPNVLKAIKERSKYELSTMQAVANRTERQAFWTSIMRNEDPHAKPEIGTNGVSKIPENISLQHRLKAAELLGKSEGDFVENINMNQNVTITDVIQQSYAFVETDDLDAIEAEYRQLKNVKIEKMAQAIAQQEHITPAKDTHVEEPSDLDSFL